MTTIRCLSRRVRAAAGERGAALVTALVLMLAMLTLTVALLNVGSDEVQVAENHLRSTQALMLAEAGLEVAFTTLRQNPALFAGAPAGLTALAVASPVAAFGTAGAYNVQYQRAGGGNTAVTVVSTGSGQAGSLKTLRSTITIAYTTPYALTAGKDIEFKSGGRQDFAGECGSAFANGDLKAEGFHGTVSGTLDAHGKRQVNPDSVGGAGGLPLQPMPPIVPADFLNAAVAALPANTVFQMKADGRVLDGKNQLITTLLPGQSFNYFIYIPSFVKGGKKGGSVPATWTLGGNMASPGTYYFEGNAVVAGSPGTAASPWRATLIAAGDVAINGSPTTIFNLPNVLLVAGGNISINTADIGDESGGGDNSGIVAARGDIKLGGSTKINGYIVAEGSVNLASRVSFNFDCGNLISPIPGTIKMTRTWGL